jgi:RNA polymerase-binding protein DksA
MEDAMQKQESIRQRLTARRADLTQRLERINLDMRHVRKPLDADFEEQAVERENDEVLDALSETLRTELAQIEAALGRLDSGNYGICQVCGREIPAARLEALPYASHCVDCEEKNQAG